MRHLLPAVVGSIVLAVVVGAGGWYVERIDRERARLADLLRPFETAAAAVFPDAKDPAAALAALRARVADLMAAGALTAAPRGIGDAQQRTMRDVLSAETAADRAVWFEVAPGNPEVTAVAETLRRTFAQAGWQVFSRPARVNLKPGLFFMIADENPPAYVATALQAFEQAGVQVTSASGYRAYYEEMKRTNPSWTGIQLAPDQAYAIVVGPKPTS